MEKPHLQMAISLNGSYNGAYPVDMNFYDGNGNFTHSEVKYVYIDPWERKISMDYQSFNYAVEDDNNNGFLNIVYVWNY